MFKHPTVDRLRELKLNTMAQMLYDPDPSLRELSFEDRLGIMVEKEWLHRKDRQIQRLIKSATLGMNACMEDIDYTCERNIDKSLLLQLSSCLYLEQKLNIVVTGKTGCGKSYLICALGQAACRKGFRVKYTRIPELLLDRQDAKNEHTVRKFMNQLQKVQLLILDDIGLTPFTLEESRDILEIVESRYHKGSIILSGQIPHTKWYELFPDPTVADAIMDRVIHDALIITLDSKRSMREIMAKKRKLIA